MTIVQNLQLFQVILKNLTELKELKIFETDLINRWIDDIKLAAEEPDEMTNGQIGRTSKVAPIMNRSYC
jgi:hypothetical protein